MTHIMSSGFPYVHVNSSNLDDLELKIAIVDGVVDRDSFEHRTMMVFDGWWAMVDFDIKLEGPKEYSRTVHIECSGHDHRLVRKSFFEAVKFFTQNWGYFQYIYGYPQDVKYPDKSQCVYGISGHYFPPGGSQTIDGRDENGNRGNYMFNVKYGTSREDSHWKDYPGGMGLYG